MNSPSELMAELVAAMHLAGIQDFQVKNSELILRDIRESFVEGNPRSWWLSLKGEKTIFPYENNEGYLHLGEIVDVNPDEKIWFVVDEDGEFMHIFNIPFEKVKNVVEECRYFEYYVAAKDCSWLIAENDHGDLMRVQPIGGMQRIGSSLET